MIVVCPHPVIYCRLLPSQKAAWLGRVERELESEQKDLDPDSVPEIYQLCDIGAANSVNVNDLKAGVNGSSLCPGRRSMCWLQIAALLSGDIDSSDSALASFMAASALGVSLCAPTALTPGGHDDCLAPGPSPSPSPLYLVHPSPVQCSPPSGPQPCTALGRGEAANNANPLQLGACLHRLCFPTDLLLLLALGGWLGAFSQPLTVVLSFPWPFMLIMEFCQHQESKDWLVPLSYNGKEQVGRGRVGCTLRALSPVLHMPRSVVGPFWSLQSQHEELKKQHSDLEEEHRKQGDDFSRTFSDHKQRYLQLQQEKEQELSKLKETVYNLREENRQLRKAHQDMHTQLQDVKQQHKNLLTAHEHLVVTLEDHKSALAAAQTQVAEYKQLKDTLNKIPSFRKPDRVEEQNVIHVAPSRQGDFIARERKITEEPKEGPHSNEKWQDQEPAIGKRTAETKSLHPTPKEVEFRPGDTPSQREEQEPRRREEQDHQVEEENKRELEEEAMEQVGQAEHLVEEQEQAWKEPQEQREEETNLLTEHAPPQAHPSEKAVTRAKSAYEEQLEQQRLAARRAEEAQQLRERQESLRKQRLQEHLLRQQRLQERELALQQQAALEDEQHRQKRLRQQTRYDAMDNDIVQGAEEQGIQEEEGGAYERDNQHQDETEDDTHRENEPRGQVRQADNPEPDQAAGEDVNPADDPNNQGEDEFEEAEQVREESLPEEKEVPKQSSQKRGNAEMEERLGMAGNPDQQEDNVDEQYQEEGEEEGQEDLAEERKRELERNAEEPYGENDDNVDDKNNDAQEQEAREANPRKGREENYEEEEEEEEGGAVEKARGRAEM
ncbi:Golgi integral membrane protein 4 [Vombatus ursinus]|nr:Golgi integral membrane protein 4 [Vombatus ursinus]